MKRIVKSMPLTASESNFLSRIESDDCPPDGIGHKAALKTLLETIVSTHGLLDCGPHFMQKLKVWYDGERWVAELEATGIA